jgi:hypothetical protein
LSCPYLSSCLCVCLVPLVVLSLSVLLFLCLPGAPGCPVLIFPPVCLPGAPGCPVIIFPPACVSAWCPYLSCPYLSSCLCVCLVPLIVLSLSFLLLVCLPGAPGCPVLIFPLACVSAWCPWLSCPYLSSCLCVCLVPLVVLSLSVLLFLCLPGAPGCPVLIFPPVCLPGAPGCPVIIFPPACVSAWCP